MNRISRSKAVAVAVLMSGCAAAAVLMSGSGGGDGTGNSITVVRGGLSAASSATGTDTTASATADTPCVPGTWTATPPDPHDPVNSLLPFQFETQHFVFRFQSGVTTIDQAKQAGDRLEYIWGQYIDRIGFPEPDCRSTTKLKANVYVGNGYGLSAGPDALNHMAIYVPPSGLRNLFGLAHEFTHALQASTFSFRDSPYGGWMWEMHAQWMTSQLPEFHNSTNGAIMSVNYPHLYWGTSRMNYNNWQFFEYLKDRYGYKVINDIWRTAPKLGAPGSKNADPAKVLMQNMGWNLAQLNDAFGDWTMHNANWDYTNPDGTDQGPAFRASFGGYEPQLGDRLLRTTILDPIDLGARRFAVPASWAPQRWGYNLVKLYPDGGATSVKVAFRGVMQAASATATLPGLNNEPKVIPSPDSGWRWGLVAVSNDGASRYSQLKRAADGHLLIALQPGDKGLYMIVLAAPTRLQHIRFDQPWYSIYRYPWMAQFQGAMPAGYQADAPIPIPGGHKHPNGGGWVAANAMVDGSAYVGPYARVLSGVVRGNARIEDHAVVDGGQVLDNARASALSIIRRSTVLKDNARAATTFEGLGEYGENILLSGTAQDIGDVSQDVGSYAKGVYYGYVEQAATSDPKQGANLTAPVPEVTATPNYSWP